MKEISAKTEPTRYRDAATAEDCYGRARLYARCCSLAAADKHWRQLDPEQTSYGDLACGSLGNAIWYRGFKDLARIEKDSAFDSIRSRANFQRLLAELKATQPGR